MLSEKLESLLAEYGAKGAFAIRNMKSGEKISYNSSRSVPSASLIKLFILVHAFELIRDNKQNLSDLIMVKSDDVVDFSVLTFLKPREYELEELLRLMVVYSDNTATNVLIDYFGMEEINETIRRTGCDNSVLARKMMDFDAAKEGRQNYTTADDMFGLMIRLYEGNLLGREYDDAMLEIMKGQADEEMMRRYIPDEITIARKSGELDALNHDVAVVYTEKLDYIFVFFSWDGGTCNNTRELVGRASELVYNDFMAD